MTDLHHWARVKSLFLEAADLDPEARRIFLDRETGGDPVLRGQVEEMLAADEGAGDFLEESASGVLAGGVAELLAQTAAFQGGFLPGGAPGLPSPSPWVGRRFGPYEVVGELGRGGVGVVLLGVRADGRYDRKVALKVVPASMVQGHLADRFRTEIRILGELDHPNIARLLDAGETPEGLAYLVMEYVDGPRIDHFADGGSLDVRARLALFRKVLEGVDYAHARGVVHRDLKPSNILVSATGEPKLVDFGIARLLEPQEEGSSQPDPTRSALRMMTLEYASPEQVRGEPLDPRTDVYSAGVVLYRLLTGFPPYSLDTTAPYGAERVICEEAPTRPSVMVTRASGSASPGITAPQGDPDILARQRSSTRDRLQRQFRGDLDTLVLHSLAKERERRYATAGAFGDDIDRYLEGSPIRASAPGLGYRTRHFLRRRRVVLAATLAASLALLAVASQAREAQVQRMAAEERSVELTGVVNSVLQTLDRDMAGEDLGPTATRAAAVEAAVRSLDEVLARTSGTPNPELLRELAHGYRQVGMLQGHPSSPNVGRMEDSQQSLEKSLDLLIRLAAVDGGSVDTRMWIANTRTLLGDFHRIRGNFHDQSRLLEQALATSDSLAREYPETMVLLRSRLAIHERLTWQAEARGDLPGAVAMAEHMSGFSARLAALAPPGAARVSSTEALALTLQQESYLLSKAGEAERAVEVQRRALELGDSLAAGEGSTQRRRTMQFELLSQLGWRFNDADRPAEAEEVFTRALELNAREREEDPRNQVGLVSRGIILEGRGQARIRGERWLDALEDHRGAIAILTPLLGDMPTAGLVVAQAHRQVGEALTRLGRFDEAGEAYRVSLEMATALHLADTTFAGAGKVLALSHFSEALHHRIRSAATGESSICPLAVEAESRATELWNRLGARGHTFPGEQIIWADFQAMMPEGVCPRRLDTHPSASGKA